MKINLSTLYLSFLGLGFSPFFPGTVASVVTALAMGYFAPGIWTVGVLAVLLSAIALEIFRLNPLVDSDPSWVVIDEVVGMLVAAMGVATNPYACLLALVVFRIFDITKPWLIGKAEKLPGMWGILADDILAGVAANIVVQLTLLIVRF